MFFVFVFLVWCWICGWIGQGYQSSNGKWCFSHHIPQVYAWTRPQEDQHHLKISTVITFSCSSPHFLFLLVDQVCQWANQLYLLVGYSSKFVALPLQTRVSLYYISLCLRYSWLSFLLADVSKHERHWKWNEVSGEVTQLMYKDDADHLYLIYTQAG